MTARALSDWAHDNVTEAIADGTIDAVVSIVADVIYHAGYMSGFSRGYAMARESLGDAYGITAVQRSMEVALRFVTWVLERPERAACFGETDDLSAEQMITIMETCDDERGADNGDAAVRGV